MISYSIAVAFRSSSNTIPLLALVCRGCGTPIADGAIPSAGEVRLPEGRGLDAGLLWCPCSPTGQYAQNAILMVLGLPKRYAIKVV